MKDMSYLKEMPIAILGAGGVGKPCAADIALAGGREVRLWDDPKFAPKTLKDVEKHGLDVGGLQENLYKFQRSGKAYVDMVSDDLAKVVKGAGIVVVAVVSLGHEALFEKLMPLLEDGQVVCVIPDNYGCLKLRKMMYDAKCETKVIIGGLGTSPYGARVMRKGGITTNEINIMDRVCLMRMAALPSKDTDIFMEAMKYFPPLDACMSADRGDGEFGFQKGSDILDIALSNVNPVLHVPGTIMGVSTLQNFELLGHKLQNFSMYSHAFCPGISEVQVKFWEEEEALARAIGCDLSPVDKEYFFCRSSIYGVEYYGKGYKIPFEEDYSGSTPWLSGPFSLEDRYVTEDIPVGCHMISLLGKKFGVATPVVDAMILLGSVMLKRDLTKDSHLSLEYLGIAHMTKEELHKWLHEGIYTEA